MKKYVAIIIALFLPLAASCSRGCFQRVDRQGNVDFSTGWTFTAKLATKSTPGTVLATKSTGITGAATSPNVVIDWSTTEWSALAPATGGTVHVVHLTARRT